MALIFLITIAVAGLIAWLIMRRLSGIAWGTGAFLLAWLGGWAAGWAFGWALLPAEEFRADYSKALALRIVGNTFWYAGVGAGLGLWASRLSKAKDEQELKLKSLKGPRTEKHGVELTPDGGVRPIPKKKKKKKR